MQGLRLRQLQARAQQLGVAEEALDDAEEKSEVIALILAQVEEQAAAEAATRRARLEEELGGMKLRALQRKAEQLGVDQAKLDEAEDKAAVTALILELALGEMGPELGPELSEPEPQPESGPLNEPGHWDAMISYTQRNPAAELLAEGVHTSFTKRGKTVWLDIKMGKLNTAAMEEGVRNSKCVIAVVTGAYTRPQGLAAEGEQPVDNAYFKRTYCVSELRWAVAAERKKWFLAHFPARRVAII